MTPRFCGKNMNNRQKLANHILEWHGGQGSGLYALGSSWLGNHSVDFRTISRACLELTSVSKKEVPFPVTVSKSDIKEVLDLRMKILRMANVKGSVHF